MTKNTGRVPAKRSGQVARNLMSKTTKYSKVAEAKVLAHIKPKWDDRGGFVREVTDRNEQHYGDLYGSPYAGSAPIYVEVKTTAHVANTGAIAIEEVQNEYKSKRDGVPDGWLHTGRYNLMVWYLPNNDYDLMLDWKQFKEWYKDNKNNYMLRTRNRTGTSSHYRNVKIEDILAGCKGAKKIMIDDREEDAETWAEWLGDNYYHRTHISPATVDFDYVEASI